MEIRQYVRNGTARGRVGILHDPATHFVPWDATDGFETGVLSQHYYNRNK
jgi:hypothetical protein